MPTQAHSKAIWRESSASGVVLDAAPWFWQADGADVVLSPDRPEDFVFADVDDDGNFTLVDVASAAGLRRLESVLVAGTVYFY